MRAALRHWGLAGALVGVWVGWMGGRAGEEVEGWVGGWFGWRLATGTHRRRHCRPPQEEMPKSKRAKVVSLTKTDKGGYDAKKRLIEEVSG